MAQNGSKILYFFTPFVSKVLNFNIFLQSLYSYLLSELLLDMEIISVENLDDSVISNVNIPNKNIDYHQHFFIVDDKDSTIFKCKLCIAMKIKNSKTIIKQNKLKGYTNTMNHLRSK